MRLLVETNVILKACFHYGCAALRCAARCDTYRNTTLLVFLYLDRNAQRSRSGNTLLDRGYM